MSGAFAHPAIPIVADETKGKDMQHIKTRSLSGKLMALFMALVLACGASITLSQSAYAEGDDTIAITLENSTNIGYNDDYEAPICFVQADKAYSTVDFSNFGGDLESVTMIYGVGNNTAVDGETSAAIGPYATDADTIAAYFEDYLNEAAEDIDFSSDMYAFWLGDDEGNMAFVLMKMAAPVVEEDLDQTFTVSINGEPMMNVTKTDDAYEYFDWSTSSTIKVPLYTVSIPAGTKTVDLTYAKPRLTYNYENGVYQAGGVEDPTKGATSITVKVDCNNNGVIDAIQVQRPYIVQGDNWLDGTLLYAITFEEVPVNITEAIATLSHDRYIYNGKKKTPLVTVTAADGTQLVKGTDYTVSLQSGRTKVGTYKVTISGIGNYCDSQVLTFDVNPKATSIRELIAGTKSLKIKYAKVTTQTSGYQVRYSTDSDFGTYKTKTIATTKYSSTTLSKLQGKTKYYVKIRTYKTVDGKKYYSAWSSTKSATAK